MIGDDWPKYSSPEQVEKRSCRSYMQHGGGVDVRVVLLIRTKIQQGVTWDRVG